MAKSFENPDQPSNTPEKIEGQESVEKQAEAEIHLKEQEIYQLVGPPEVGKTRVEIVDANTDEPRFMMSKIMEPQEDEKRFLPGGSAMTVTMHGTRKQEQDSTYWEVTGAKFEMGGKSLKLKDVLPEDCKLVLNKAETNAYMHPKKAVSLNRLSEIDDVVTLLHEAGHAGDENIKEQLKLEIPDEPSLEWIEEQRVKLLASQQKRERDAWASAHRTAREAEWPIQKLIKNRSARDLATYDAAAAQQLMRDTMYDQFASSEQRRAMKSPEKQQEAQQLKELGQYTEDVPLAISHYLDIPLDEMLKKDEARGGKSMTVRFYVPEENKYYIVDVLQHEGEKHEQINSLSLTEMAGDEEGKPDDVLVVTIHGGRMARVTEGKLQMGEETEPQLETKWEGKMGVLVADENTKEATATYQKAKELLSCLDKETVGGRMVVETFRQMYSDVSEPPSYDSETGEKLGLEKKIEYMKEQSRLYNIMEDFKKELDDIMSRHPEEE